MQGHPARLLQNTHISASSFSPHPTPWHTHTCPSWPLCFLLLRHHLVSSDFRPPSQSRTRGILATHPLTTRWQRHAAAPPSLHASPRGTTHLVPIYLIVSHHCLCHSLELPPDLYHSCHSITLLSNCVHSSCMATAAWHSHRLHGAWVLSLINTKHKQLVRPHP